jgi:hypothetical protein
VTAREAIHRAVAAGLTLRPDPGGLRVTGPKQARAAWLPLLRPLTAEILGLLAEVEKVAQGSGPPLAPENMVSEENPCNECGRPAWLSLVATDGARTCVECLTGRTAMRARRVPLRGPRA